MDQKNHRNDHKYKGSERRTCPNAGACLDHSGIVERTISNEKDIQNLKEKNFVTFSNYKWSIGILASILISLFSIAIYLALDTSKSLHTISAKQETTIYKITDIQKEMDDLKRTSTDELKGIKQKLHQHNQRP